MKWFRFRRLGREGGQSLVEFALVIPILLLLIFGIFDFGRLLYAYMHMHIAAQETVRLGGLGRSDTDITTFAHNYVHLGNSSLLQVTITPTQTMRKPGEYITVKLSYPLTYMTPVISKLFPAPVVSASSTIRIE